MPRGPAFGQAIPPGERRRFVQTIEHRQGLKIACLEEVAFHKGYITADQVLEIARFSMDNEYCQYLRRLVEDAGRP